MSKRHQDRLSMGPGAILTVNEAAHLLPVADAAARAWLRREGLIVTLDDKPVVCWADVLAELSAGKNPDDPPTRKRRLPRITLKPI
jgi:hypothetical protein